MLAKEVLTEGWLADVLQDSLDDGWTATDGARAIMRALGSATILPQCGGQIASVAFSTQPPTSQCCGCGASLGAFHNSSKCSRKVRDEPLVTSASCDDGRSGAVPSQAMINAGWAVFPEGEAATEETLSKAWAAMWKLSKYALTAPPIVTNCKHCHDTGYCDWAHLSLDKCQHCSDGAIPKARG